MDPIDKAIKSSAEPKRIQFPLTFGGDEGRAGALVLPADLQPGEMIGLIAFLTTVAMPAIVAAQQESQSKLMVPTRPTLLVPH